jgi:hypothetical protein
MMSAQAQGPPPESVRHAVASAARPAGEVVKLTPVERDHLLRSIITSQALEGVHISYEQASRILDEVLLEPMPDL